MLLRGKRRWVVSLLLGFSILLIIVAHRGEEGSVREHASALVGGHDYSPYANSDAFEDFKQTDQCRLKSLDIYRPIKHLCQSREEVMDAMSYGGRIGFDAPYQTRDCDMRWYTTAELCSILSRFDAIHIVGDSMMRHLAQSLNVYLREDIVTGARTTWLSGNPDGLDCSCRTVFDKHDCATEGYAAIGTADLWEHDPNSIKCGVRMREAKLSAGKSQGKGGIASVDFLASMKGPPEDREVSDFRKSIQSGKKEAFVFGQGGWDDFEMEPAKKWIEAFEGALADEMPSFIRPPVTTAEKKGDEEKTGDAIGKPVLARRADDWRSKFPVSKDHPPRLWVSPNAQGVHKNPFFVLGQNNIKLMGFETGMRSWLADRGFDSLGIFNLTVQSTSLDGTHATMESNLVKAMMVFNWLDWVSKES